MDFGALVCTPASPACVECLLRERCRAREAGTVAGRPVKQGRTAVRDRWFHYLHITSEDRTLLCRREGRDIWQGLYEFPLLETPEAAAFETLLALPRFRELLGGAAWRLLRTIPLPKHQLSHQRIHATVYRIETPSLSAAAAALAVDTAAGGDYAVPRLLERYLLEYDGQPAGYAMLARAYSTECGGPVLWIEELYVREAFRSKGLGHEFFDFLEKAFSGEVCRFRLEVEPENTLPPSGL